MALNHFLYFLLCLLAFLSQFSLHLIYGVNILMYFSIMFGFQLHIQSLALISLFRNCAMLHQSILKLFITLFELFFKINKLKSQICLILCSFVVVLFKLFNFGSAFRFMYRQFFFPLSY